MKAFVLVPQISEYKEFADFAKEAELGSKDLILTNEYIYRPVIEQLGLGCKTLFQEKFGAGEPTDVMVNGILDALRSEKYERIIAVGGGTVIDIAKVLAVATENDTVDALYDRVDNLEKVHPLLIVPTTCGTGSEVTNIAIMNRTTRGVKQGLVSPNMFADEAVLVPGMLMSLPYGVFATSSIDAMIHAVESYLSPNACALSETFSEKALSLLLPAWKRAAEAGGDAWKKDATDFLRASNYAGIGFGHAGCAAVHALSYPLSGVHHVAHGESNQVMFAAVMRKYVEKQPVGKLNQLEALIAPMLACAPEQAMQELYALMDRILVRKPMREYGVTPEELPVYADRVIETQQRLLKNNYVPLTRDEILEIYESAY